MRLDLDTPASPVEVNRELENILVQQIIAKIE